MRWLVSLAPGLLQLVRIDEFFDRVDCIIVVFEAICFGILSLCPESYSQLLFERLRFLELLF